jgi:hypothetical protein
MKKGLMIILTLLLTTSTVYADKINPAEYLPQQTLVNSHYAITLCIRTNALAYNLMIDVLKETEKLPISEEKDKLIEHLNNHIDIIKKITLNEVKISNFIKKALIEKYKNKEIDLSKKEHAIIILADEDFKNATKNLENIDEFDKMMTPRLEICSLFIDEITNRINEEMEKKEIKTLDIDESIIM